ncbi:MAG: DUF2339 domain-containing protein, partial [Acidobacteriota bacterium]|nr:DUF2339 domain-containing protein [Acidobacteriota bacterium]
RAGAQSLALIAAAGGYATPLLIRTGGPTASILFSYTLLLGLAALVLTRRHRWLGLPALSYVLTVGTIASWAASYYTDDQWLVVLTFLTALCAVFVEVLRYVRRLEGSDSAVIAAVLWSAPVVYHGAAVVITVDHPPAIHVYLILVTVVTLLVTAGRDSGWVRLPALAAAYVPLFGYVDLPQGPSWIWPNLVTALATAGMHVMTLVDRASRQRRLLGTGDLVVLHATLIGLYGLLVQILSTPYPDWPGGVAASLAIGSAALWRFFERRDPVAALNAAGLSFTLVAIALAAQFDGRIVVIGWAVEGAVAAWVGVTASSAAFRFGGLALVGLAARRLADGFFATDPVSVVVFNDRTAATAVLVVLAYLLARHWRRHGELRESEGIVPVALHGIASLFTLMWLSAEIGAYWNARRGQPQARLSEELMRSLAWGLYGSILVAVGMWRSLVSLRWNGIAVIGLTVLKVFFVDLSELGGIYRVIGFLAVGVLLVGVSYLYQRSRIGSASTNSSAPERPSRPPAEPEEERAE